MFWGVRKGLSDEVIGTLRHEEELGINLIRKQDPKQKKLLRQKPRDEH